MSHEVPVFIYVVNVLCVHLQTTLYATLLQIYYTI